MVFLSMTTLAFQKWIVGITGLGMDLVRHMKSSRCITTAYTTTDRHSCLGLLYKISKMYLCSMAISAIAFSLKKQLKC